MRVGQVTISQTISRQGNTAPQRLFSAQNGVQVQMSGVWLLWYFPLPTSPPKSYLNICNSQVFELITGDYLFDPQSGTKYGKDDDHIAQIIELLGPFPKSLCLSGKWSQEIFNRKGELRNIHRLRHWALPDVLKEKYHFKEDEARKVAEFLVPMLELVPEKRANAGGMAGAEWLEDTVGMRGLKIEGLAVGSKGEGIEGWACEVKKR
jgi:serine/threonine-protein kinase SRPK3